jgi:hypothetical protein
MFAKVSNVLFTHSPMFVWMHNQHGLNQKIHELNIPITLQKVMNCGEILPLILVGCTWILNINVWYQILTRLRQTIRQKWMEESEKGFSRS